MTKEQCVDCGRLLHEDEFDLNGKLCNDCDQYRRDMAAEPPYEPSIAARDEKENK